MELNTGKTEIQVGYPELRSQRKSALGTGALRGSGDGTDPLEPKATAELSLLVT